MKKTLIVTILMSCQLLAAEWSFFDLNFDMPMKELNKKGFTCYVTKCKIVNFSGVFGFKELEVIDAIFPEENGKIQSFQMTFRPKDTNALIKALKEKYTSEDVKLEFWKISDYRIGMEVSMKSRLVKQDYNSLLK